jgi:cell division protein FtsA
VRLGMPQGVTGLADVVRNPIHATGVGLLQYARAQAALSADTKPLGANVRNVFDRMKSWFQGSF